MSKQSISTINLVYKDISTTISVLIEFKFKCISLIPLFIEEVKSAEISTNLIETPIELSAQFLKYCKAYDEDVAKAILVDFEASFLGNKDIHLVCHELGLGRDQVATVLNGYYSAWDLVSPVEYQPTPPAILNDKSTKLMALFGGQGGASGYFDELTFMYHAYYSLVSEFINQSSLFLNDISKDPHFADLYSNNLDFIEWLNDPEKKPSVGYLLSSPVAFPLTGITQLLQFFVTFKTLRISPGELAKSFEASVGHSHGIVVATAISCSTDEASFYENSLKALGILILIGAFGQLEYPLSTLDTDESRNSAEPSNGNPRPMVLVKGLSYESLNKLVKKFNNKIQFKDQSIHISVINTPTQIVVSGEVSLIERFVGLVSTKCASSDQDQSHIPYSQRKPVATTEYLSLTAPYHCVLYNETIDKQYQYAIDKGWILNSKDMQIIVRANDDGNDIRNKVNLTKYLFQSIMTLPINWKAAIDHSGITHIVDFGPGGTKGFGLLAYRNIEGCGISVICASAPVPGNPRFGTRADLYKSDLSSVIKAPNWAEKYSPTLLRTGFDNRINIGTKLSYLLGKPPIMVSGMTPTAANGNLVAATLNSGYHIELACGGIHTRAELENKVSKLVESIEPGCGITLNCIYPNQSQWSFQLSTITNLRRKGVPIEGICISGGVPSLNAAIEIIDTIRDAGIRHIAFNPNSIELIRQIVDISKKYPDFPVVLQWTGGRGGGHHSFEDFHQPILDTYHSIREQNNIVLVAGSGFGGADDILPYLTGEWSTRFGRASMPFDGVFFGSRMVVSKESKVADSVKGFLISAPGIDDSQCKQEYTGLIDNIITIKTEYNEPIHVIANKCSMFWKELDSTVFSVPHINQLKVILDKRDYIISHLNSDHIRPWFGTFPSGQIVDIEDMTYIEVAKRLADLLYLEIERKWVHVTYKNLFDSFLHRIEERFICTDNEYSINIIGTEFDVYRKIIYLCEMYPDAVTQLMTSEDVKYFVELCRQGSQRSVPFIPVLDEDFETWFKKDTLWQSEDLACILDQDPQRVLILQGPISAKYSTKINTPVKEILDEVYEDLITKLLENKYKNNGDLIKSVGYLSNLPIVRPLSDYVIQEISGTKRDYTLPDDISLLPDHGSWIYALSNGQLNWVHDLLMSPFVFDGKRVVDNTLRTVLRPRSRHTVRVSFESETPISVKVIDDQGLVVVDIATNELNILSVRIHNHLEFGSASLVNGLQYNPGHRLAPFYVIRDELIDPAINFYRESIRLGEMAWGNLPQLVERKLSSSYKDQTINHDRYVQYLSALNQPSFPYKHKEPGRLLIPIDYYFILAYPTIFRCITNQYHCSGVLNLVHQSNLIRIVPGSRLLFTGDIISSNSSIISAANTGSGKEIHTRSIISHDEDDIAVLESIVLIRNVFLGDSNLFSTVPDLVFRVHFETEDDISILRTKEWFVPDIQTIHRVKPGSTLQFSLETQSSYKNNKKYFLTKTLGEVMLILDDNTMIKVGNVEYADNTTVSNIVIDYLERFGSLNNKPVYFDDDEYPLLAGSIENGKFFSAPISNNAYSHVSGDHIPIHTNPYIADYAGLPTMITHGMHISALTRSFIDQYAAKNHPERVVAYSVNFVGMVLPQDKLFPQFSHVGMKDGCMIIKGRTTNSNGSTILEFTAEVEQPPTAYLFTGQGSQSVGMGMDLYDSSAVAHGIWDRGDKYMSERYGVSILDIVKRNKLKHTIYFKGERGIQIRKNYIGLVSGITEDTRHYTFACSNGLLNATQFTQVALALFEAAMIEDMRSNGLVQKSALFAGHSFGEIAALYAIGEIISLEDMLDIAFCRGILMQQAVTAGNSGYSKYGMVAVSPSRIGIGFTNNNLYSIIQAISSSSDGLIELVNYNIRNQQYVVAGDTYHLKVLSLVIDQISKEQGYTENAVDIAISNAISHVSEEQMHGKEITLEHGKAVIPIKNVNVPFHSSLMRSITAPFRKVLRKKIHRSAINYKHLCSRYIPNVTGTPFEISKEYFEKVYSITGSMEIKSIVDEWNSNTLTSNSRKEILAYMLLIELVANQVACPVQWIKTQECIIENDRAKRFIEIGPEPILSGMAKKSANSMAVDINILFTKDDHDDIYYRKPEVANKALEDNATISKGNTKAKDAGIQNSSEIKNMHNDIQPKSETVSISSSNSYPVESVPDIPLDPCYVIKVIVAQKLNKPLQEISTEASIRSLVSGKSALQNEILGDLKREFGNDMVDIQDGLPIIDLARKATSFSGVLGSHTSSLVSRLFKSKLPGGFNRSSVYSYLKSAYGLGPLRCEGVLLLALTERPSDRLATENEAKSWLDDVVLQYSKVHTIELRKGSVGSSINTSNTKAVTVAEIQAFEVAQAGQKNLSTKIIEALANSANIDLRKGDRTAEQLAGKIKELQRSHDITIEELGEDFVNGIKPMFDPLKARHFDSYWNWVRQDLLVLLYNLASENYDLDSIDITENTSMIKNRSNPALVKFMSYCIGKLKHRISDNSEKDSCYTLISKLYSECKESLDRLPLYISHRVPSRPHTTIDSSGNILYSEIIYPGVSTREDYIQKVKTDYGDEYPLLYIRKNTGYNSWEYDISLTENYFNALADVYGGGITFSGKCALITGCGKNSIGEGILKGLLMGGAKVVATTSSYSRKTMLYFEGIYKRYGSRGSELVVVPFNQGSVEDIKNLIKFIYSSSTKGAGLGWELDLVIPFAALQHQFGDVTYISSYAELSFRTMLTNIHRLLGEIANEMSTHQGSTQIVQVLLPLSPNHGQFGNDGLYSESKNGLDTLVYRWYHEPWSKYLSVIGIRIGWTRGTAMTVSTNNNNISMNMEENGIYTFTTDEMAACILSIATDSIDIDSSIEPIMMDLNGRLDRSTYLGKLVASLKNNLSKETHKRVEINSDVAIDFKNRNGASASEVSRNAIIRRRINYKQNLYKYRSYEDLKSLHYMQGMINLDKVVVVTGFGEVGPYGHSKTRWEMEAYGKFSLEGCVDLAWVMGYIKFFNGILKSTGKQYTGWVDSKTGEPVDDIDVKFRYEKKIIEHTGIRLIEPEIHDGSDPNKKFFMRELQIEHDMEPFEASKEEAEHFKLQNGDRVDTWQKDNDAWMVRFLKGAIIMVPKAFQFDRTVVAQVPSGWDPIRYGISEDITKQVDPSVCYSLVATVEALLRSGITDPYELYNYFHVSKVGSTVGAGLPSRKSNRIINIGQLMDWDYPKDIIQESLIGIVSAWTNMLLLSSSGPIKPVSGACATSILSIDTAVEIIQSGKAEVVFTGGFDDYEHIAAYEYGQMGATNNSLNEVAHGRTPAEMSRPFTSTRNGFMEGEGAGIAVLMSASAAIKMGAPIYGIIALSNTATDKIGRSVPAPGQGILTTASESVSSERSEMLDFNYRKAKLERHLQLTDQWQNEMRSCSKSEIKKLNNMRKSAQDEWGNEFWKNDSSISPLRGSLAVWGLDINDIGVVSFHGTSTLLNDINEPEVFNTQFKHLGRAPGNIVPVIAQKWLTGHPKGAAAAWMLNGMLQVLDTGLVPGNRNADNIEEKLEQFEYLVYPSKSIQTPGIKAGLLKSFGFGQAGGELLIVHPDYILATLSHEELEQYQDKIREREKKVYRYWHDTLVDKHKFVQVKDDPPYTKEQEQSVYLDPNARVKYDPRTKKYHF